MFIFFDFNKHSYRPKNNEKDFQICFIYRQIKINHIKI